MKIQEFRDKMKQCKREDVEKIAAELYTETYRTGGYSAQIRAVVLCGSFI